MVFLDLSHYTDTKHIKSLFSATEKPSANIGSLNDNLFVPALDNEMDFDNIFSIVKKWSTESMGGKI